MIGAYILIALGLILLGVNFGYLDASVWAVLWKFWPVVLILFGLSILTKKYMPKYLGIIIGAIVILGALASMVYVARGGKISPLKSNTKTASSNTLNVDEPLSSGIKKVDLEMKLGAQNIKIDSTESGLINGQINNSASASQVLVYNNGDVTKIDISSKFGGIWWNRNKANDSHLSLTNQVPLDVTLKLGATNIDADLSDLILNHIDLKVGAFNGKIRYGKRQNMAKTAINAGASDIKLYVPKSSGIKVDYSNGLVGMKYTGLDMQKNNQDRQDKSNNYDSAENKLDFDLKAGASSVEFIGY